MFLVPLGILNETHEPPTFYGVERNDVESIIIPSTWWEAGAGLSGNFANGLSWNAAFHSGLEMPASGSSAFRVRSGRQKVAEALASNFASTFRLRYTGVPGRELSASYQYQSDPSQIPGDTGKQSLLQFFLKAALHEFQKSRQFPFLQELTKLQ